MLNVIKMMDGAYRSLVAEGRVKQGTYWKNGSILFIPLPKLIISSVTTRQTLVYHMTIQYFATWTVVRGN
jgi:hypothetical protein